MEVLQCIVGFATWTHQGGHGRAAAASSKIVRLWPIYMQQHFGSALLEMLMQWPFLSPRLQNLYSDYPSLAEPLHANLQARAAVLTASQCATYNEAKTAWMALTNGGDTLSTHVGASMISGLVTTTLTAPVDVIKTNMFVGESPSSGATSNANPLRICPHFNPLSYLYPLSQAFFPSRMAYICLCNLLTFWSQLSSNEIVKQIIDLCLVFFVEALANPVRSMALSARLDMQSCAHILLDFQAAINTLAQYSAPRTFWSEKDLEAYSKAGQQITSA